MAAVPPRGRGARAVRGHQPRRRSQERRGHAVRRLSAAANVLSAPIGGKATPFRPECSPRSTRIAAISHRALLSGSLSLSENPPFYIRGGTKPTFLAS